MKITNAICTPEDRLKIYEAINEVRFPSNLKVFQITNGLRPGELTVIIAPKGMGKSTLVKTVVVDMLVGFKKTLIILSEENSSLYKMSITNSFYKFAKSESSADAFLENCYLDSMLDWENDEKNSDSFLEHIEEQINSKQLEAIVFDNFSTSFLGSLPISKQEQVITDLRSLANLYDIAFICVFHTIKGTNIYKSLIDAEDVRGNAVSANIGAYNYVLSTFFRTTPPRSFLHIDKARYHPKANKTYWELKFDEETGLFTEDKETDYAEIEGLIRSVNKASTKREVNLNTDVWSNYES